VELAVRWHLAYEAFDGLREDITDLVQVSKLAQFRWLEPVGERLGDFLRHLLLDTAQAQRRFLGCGVPLLAFMKWIQQDAGVVDRHRLYLTLLRHKPTTYCNENTRRCNSFR